MQTTAFRKQAADGKLLPDDRQAETKALNLLMRTKGWSKALADGYLKTLQPDELNTLARLEEAPNLRGDEVNQVIDEVEDRIAAEEALKKQQAAEMINDQASMTKEEPDEN